MKNYKFPFLGVILTLLIISCKKEDVQKTATANNSLSNINLKSSQWNSLSNWSSSKTENITTYFSTLPDSAITADVANAGLILVYKKNGNDIQSLPFQEKDSKIYWYYQVSKGSIRISSDNSDGQNLGSYSFSYFIFTPQQISFLEAKGKTKLNLLQLSYGQAASILN